MGNDVVRHAPRLNWWVQLTVGPDCMGVWLGVRDCGCLWKVWLGVCALRVGCAGAGCLKAWCECE